MDQTTLTKQFLTGEIVTKHTNLTTLSGDNLEYLTDSQLYQLCREYGLNTKKWLRKFAGLLPEVKERELYKRRGCASIHHFASKLAGMNHELTDRIIRIGKNLKDKPHLKKLFEKGKVGWSKLELIAYISTPETDEKWAKKVVDMPCDALRIFVQEYRKREKKKLLQKPHVTSENRTQNDIILHNKFDNDTNISSKITDIGNFAQQKDNVVQLSHEEKMQNKIFQINQSDTDERWSKLILHLHPKIEFKLRMRKFQIEKHKRETLSWNEVFTEITKNWNLTSPMLKKIPKEKVINWETY